VTRGLKYLAAALWLALAAFGVPHAQQRVNTATGVLTYPSTLGTGQFLTSWTVARLVTTIPCTARTIGSSAYVTDAASPAYNVALTGGGSGAAAHVQAWCNGTAWVGQ
jgi:hypothetical protein